MQHNNTLFIIRGIPGSGKSTVAQRLCRAFHFEADQYFLNEMGEYVFVPEKIADAHKWCQEAVRKAMILNQSDVAVSNTFTRRWEYQSYIDMADEYGYNVQIIECTSYHGSIHNVPQESIDKMRARWEPHSP